MSTLPRTGIDALALVLVAVGLVLIGSAAREAARTVLAGRPR
jgi:LPXTG-motif cell wall-anchored protein